MYPLFRVSVYRILFIFRFQFNPIVIPDSTSENQSRDYSLATKKKSKNRLQDDGLQHIADQGNRTPFKFFFQTFLRIHFLLNSSRLHRI